MTWCRCWWYHTLLELCPYSSLSRSLSGMGTDWQWDGYKEKGWESHFQRFTLNVWLQERRKTHLSGNRWEEEQVPAQRGEGSSFPVLGFQHRARLSETLLLNASFTQRLVPTVLFVRSFNIQIPLFAVCLLLPQQIILQSALRHLQWHFGGRGGCAVNQHSPIKAPFSNCCALWLPWFNSHRVRLMCLLLQEAATGKVVIS